MFTHALAVVLATASPQACVPDRDAAVVRAWPPDPSEATRRQLTADTALPVLVRIDAAGHVTSARVESPSPVFGLDGAALQAARLSLFAAGAASCVPAGGEYRYVVTFLAA